MQIYQDILEKWVSLFVFQRNLRLSIQSLHIQSMNQTEGNQRKATFSIRYQEKIQQTADKSNNKEYSQPKLQHLLNLSLSNNHETVALGKLSHRTAANKRNSLDINTVTESAVVQKKDPSYSESLPAKMQKKKRQLTISYDMNKSLVQSKRFIRVPLTFYDQDAYGASWQGQRGRVVYRRGNPKSSQYIFGKLKQASPDFFQRIQNKAESQTDLEFNSKFESGNLSLASRVSKNEYHLYPRQDTNTHGLRQWYYFQVKSNRPIKVHFKIYKFSKPYILYRKGMHPYVKRQGSYFQQQGQNLTYLYDQNMKCYVLSFDLEFYKEKEVIEIANMPPYTYSCLRRFTEDLRVYSNISIRSIGQSLGGLQIPLIQITGKNESDSRRQAIIVLGRTHPGQTCSSFSLESFINQIILSELASHCDFFIIPMVNPDGVFIGNHRTGLIGVDLNRKFQANRSDKDLYPEVEGIKELVRRVSRTHIIEFILDMHGHSARKNIFAFGEEHEIRSQRYLKGKVLPKILSQICYGFKYNFCIFKKQKEKSKTARMYFSQLYQLNTITFEQSYGLILQRLISIEDWKNFGIKLADSLEIYFKRYNNKLQLLKEYLKPLILEQQLKKAQQNSKRLLLSQKIIKVEDLNNRQDQKYQQILPYLQGRNEQNLIKELQQGTSEEQENESLQSGQEQLECNEFELQLLKKQLFFKGKQMSKREIYPIPDKNLYIRQKEDRRNSPIQVIHQKKMPIMYRIMKMKERKNSEIVQMLTQRRNTKGMSPPIKSILYEQKIKLPNLSKYLF